MLATKLNLSANDAERWIVNLIRNAKLDAKIDGNTIVLHTRLVGSNYSFRNLPPNYSHGMKLLSLRT